MRWNLVMQGVIPALWLFWGAYWWASAYGVKAARRREGRLSRAAHIVPLVVAAALLSAPISPRSGVWYWAGVAAVIVGLAFSVWARRVIGRNWSGTVTLKEEHELVQSGPYRRIRHPIYTGILLAFLGSAMARGDWRGLLAFAIAGIALWRKLKLEERWLGEMFGARYAAYRQTSWALIPGVL